MSNELFGIIEYRFGHHVLIRLPTLKTRIEVADGAIEETERGFRFRPGAKVEHEIPFNLEARQESMILIPKEIRSQLKPQN